MAAQGQWTLARLLQAHPWAAELEASGALEYLWRFELDCSPELLWERIIDTSRLNRALGLSDIELSEHDGTLQGTSVNGGVAHEWVEAPWNWVTARLMVAERAYSRGFARHVRVIYLLEPRSGGGVVCHTYFGWLARSWWSGLLLRVGMWAMRARLDKVLRELADDPEAERPALLKVPAEPLPSTARIRLDAARVELVERGHDEAAVDRLVELIVDGDPVDVSRLQVPRLAREWRMPERELLRLCLHATRVGMLELSWDVICPHCRGVRAELTNLGDVPAGGSCDACDIEFGTEGPNAIEVTFHIHSAVRVVPKLLFCSAQTSAKRHIRVQQVLAPGAERVVETALEPGRYRARVQGRHQVAMLDVRPEVEARELHWSASDDVGDHARCPGLSLHLSNDSDQTQTFIVEDVNWADAALRPGDLFAVQEFRDLFSEQYISADVQLSVGEQTVLFTDIVGSTSLYIDRGDPEAFVEVRKHFSKVYRVIRDHEGAVVKTIGDAAMASFTDPVQALSAAHELQCVFGSAETDSPVRLRISLNTGVCIAVNLNSNIDFFGHTVNLAAKLQLLAGAGDIVISDQTYNTPGVKSFLDRNAARVDDVDFDFKPLGRLVEAHRWRTVLDDDDETCRMG